MKEALFPTPTPPATLLAFKGQGPSLHILFSTGSNDLWKIDQSCLRVPHLLISRFVGYNETAALQAAQRLLGGGAENYKFKRQPLLT